jgi:hypothetical protein
LRASNEAGNVETVRRCFNSDGFAVCFDLCVKRGQQLGPIEVDHWWMDVRRLYAQRRSAKSHNRRAILRYYWEAVRSQKAEHEPIAQERLLLSELLPVMRSQGSRTIFKDAKLRRDRTSVDQQVTLEAMLAANRRRYTNSEFTEVSRSALARTAFPPGTQVIYNAMKSQLLEEAKTLLKQDKMDWALDCLSAKWKSVQKTIGRRQGHAQEKIVLDALSYEARAAFHDLYSVAWIALIQGVLPHDGLSSQSAEFLEFWHTSITHPTTGQHLFHGHVLGLHPACGPILQTPTGRRLMGEWLLRHDHESYGLLLGGLVIAIDFYRSLSDERRLTRTGPGHHSQGSLEQLVAEEDDDAEDDATDDD